MSWTNLFDGMEKDEVEETAGENIGNEEITVEGLLTKVEIGIEVTGETETGLIDDGMAEWVWRENSWYDEVVGKMSDSGENVAGVMADMVHTTLA